jgi:ketosteroid isomerase-like protein
MSQENVELSHRVYDALIRRDLDALLALYDPDVEAEPTGGVVFGTSYHGHDGARRFWNELFSAFPDFSAEVLEVRDLGNLVLGVVRFRGHGAGSDAPVEQTVWQIAEWRDRKVVWWRSCASESEALEAVGLRE